MLIANQIINGEITSLAFGGSGILRYEGFVVFVPYTAVGDHIKCQISKVKKNFAEAELLEVTEKSPLRVIARCPYFGTCGGCQLQHMNDEAQTSQKRTWVQEALRKIGGFEDQDLSVQPTSTAEKKWVYRRHIHLKLMPKAGFYEAGYTANDQKSLLPVEQCVIFIEQENPLLKEIQTTVKQLVPPDGTPGKLTVLKDHEAFILHFHFKKLPQNAEVLLNKALGQYSHWKGVVLGSPNKTIHLGNCEATTHIEDLAISYSANVFMQNYPEQSLKIYKQIVAIAKEIRARYVLDLYCGIGITSLLLGKEGIETTGIEYSHKSIEKAIQNAKANKITQAYFQTGQVENVLEKLLIKRQPDLVIINPPREGLDIRVIEALKAHPPQNVIYVSCMPTTLARDLHPLKKIYSLRLCRPYDMFPQTSHVETLVWLTKLFGV